MEIFIALAILALIVRIALVFLCPNVDNFLSGHGYNNTVNSDNIDSFARNNLERQLNISDSKFIAGPFKANNIDYSSLTGIQDD